MSATMELSPKDRRKKLYKALMALPGDFMKNPFLTWTRCLSKLEIKTGLPTHFISPTRMYIRNEELKMLKPLPVNHLIKLGNYFLHKDVPLDEHSTIYSAGIGINIEFDRAVQEYTGGKIHMVDPTPRTCRFIAEQNLPSNFIFHPVALYDYDGEISFYPDYLPNDLQSSSSFSIQNRSRTANKLTVPCLRLSTLVKQNGDTALDVLKMDIEGVADVVLMDGLNAGLRPHQIVCEFEIPPNPIHSVRYLKQLGKLIQRLKDEGYETYSITQDIFGARIELLSVLKSALQKT